MDSNTNVHSLRDENNDDDLIGTEGCVHSPTTHRLSEDRLRRRLQFHFMNPIEKWEAKQRIPYKFVIQLIKIILVTIQLCLYSFTRYHHVNYIWDNGISFSHLFLRGWDSTREINSYPPTAGPLAIYRIDDFYSTIDYAFDGYSNINKSIGSYSYSNEDNTMSDMVLCLYCYKKGDISGFNESYSFESKIVESCHNISYDVNKGKFNSKTYFENIDIKFSALVRATLDFSLKTVNFKSAGQISPPNCYLFDISILFDNQDQDGQMILSLNSKAVRLNCKGDVDYITEDEINSMLRSILNYLVILICFLSLALCGRAIWRAQQLRAVTESFFKSNFDKSLSSTDNRKFLNLWYVMIIVNDILIIVGSFIQEQIEREDFASDQWNVCSVFLGVGNLLVWFGVLRYLGFFKTYNVVILTMEKAAPQVARFLLCAMLIYAGFTFCGWLVLGPYHLKFKSLSTTSECLFSLINGDDMFATFTIMSTKSTMLWWFSKIYLYSFISLYIYIILSLFISVIMDAYDTIKLYYQEGFPKSDLQIFIGDTKFDDFSSGIFRSESSESLGGLIKDLCCCKKIHRSYSTIPSFKSDQPV